MAVLADQMEVASEMEVALETAMAGMEAVAAVVSAAVNNAVLTAMAVVRVLDSQTEITEKHLTKFKKSSSFSFSMCSKF